MLIDFSRKLVKNIMRILIFPLLILFFMSTEKSIITLDVKRWSEINNFVHKYNWVSLLSLLAEFQEFRNLFYYRISRGNFIAFALMCIMKIFYKECPSLYIWCKDIGPGLFIQHGFSTVIAAKSIGENCWINQQVTIGHNGQDSHPTIGNNVKIRAGAKVIGSVNIGDNVTVGANAVVIKNVPKNCVVVGVPAYVVKRDGVKTKEPLS